PSFLKLQDLLEEIGRRLRLTGSAQSHAFALQEVLHPAHRVPERAVGSVHRRGRLETDGLLLGRPEAEVVWVETPVQVVEAPLEVGAVEDEPSIEPEHGPVIASHREGLESPALGADVSGGRRRAAAPALRSIPLAHHSDIGSPNTDRASEEARSDRSPSPSRARSRYRSPRYMDSGRERGAAAAARLRVGI